jgi:hypothetical protein
MLLKKTLNNFHIHTQSEIQAPPEVVLILGKVNLEELLKEEAMLPEHFRNELGEHF